MRIQPVVDLPTSRRSHDRYPYRHPRRFLPCLCLAPAESKSLEYRIDQTAHTTVLRSRNANEIQSIPTSCEIQPQRRFFLVRQFCINDQIGAFIPVDVDVCNHLVRCGQNRPVRQPERVHCVCLAE